MFNKIKNLTIGKKVLYVVGLLVLVFIAWKIFSNSSTSAETFTVSKKDVVQKVTVTGKIKPMSEVTLSFEKTGRVSKVSAPIGSKVFAGQNLVSLDSSVPYSDYLKARANSEVEKANLDKLKKGGTEEEISLRETEVDNAKTALSNANDSMTNRLREAYSKADDAVRNNIDQLFSNPRSTNPQINVYVDNSQLRNDINDNRLKIENILLEWSKNDFSPSKENIDKTASNLNIIKNLLDGVSIAVNSLTSNYSIAQATVDGYKNSISIARTNISNTITNVSSAQEKLNSSKSSLAVAERNLDIVKAGASPESIKSQEARIMQFDAEVERTLAELSKYSLSSPINGIVTKQEADLGETVTVGTPMVSIISGSSFEIEANVSEVSIGKVALGNKVVITMDAFPGKTFLGTVSYIEPGETIVDGVVNFKIKVNFSENYPEIKTGLTVNLDIQTMLKEKALSVPDYALTRRDGKVFAIKKNAKNSTEVEVTVGLVGSEGITEILGGISEGDVIEFVPKK